MRASLLFLVLLSACTVVPTPTGTGPVAGGSSFLGNWKAKAKYGSDSLVHRLAIFSDGSYERAAIDSSPVRGNQLVLSEVGVWTIPSDTSRILFTPYSRQTWPSGSAALAPAPTSTDSASWFITNDVLTLALPRWSLRDSLEILEFVRN